MNQTIKKPELLAPAGDLERLQAALDYGADRRLSGGKSVRDALRTVQFYK